MRQDIRDAMNIVGHGVDLVGLSRVAGLFDDSVVGETLIDWLTEMERAESPSARGPRVAYVAGQIAMKEAVVKALGTGLIGEMTWTEIEVLRNPAGAPVIRLYGAVGDRADELAITAWHGSISHTDDYAVASVIAVRESD